MTKQTTIVVIGSLRVNIFHMIDKHDFRQAFLCDDLFSDFSLKHNYAEGIHLNCLTDFIEKYEKNVNSIMALSMDRQA